MGILLSCPNCFTRELQPPSEDPVPLPTDTCMNFHSSFSELQPSELICNETYNEMRNFSKSELIDTISMTLKSFIEEINQDPESLGYTKVLVSKFTEVFIKDIAGGHTLMTLWKCEANAGKLARFIRMYEKRKDWDSHISECKKICDITDDIAIYYILYKRFLTMAPRDVLLVSQQVRHEDGWIDISTSINSSILPENEKVVRAKINISGYFIREIPRDENGNNCLVIHVVEGNYGQSIAGNIAKKITASITPKFVQSLMDGLKKMEENAL